MLLITIVLWILVLEAHSNVILEPTERHGPESRDIIFIIFPQVDVPAVAYNTLGRAIQKVSPFKLWIGIVENKGSNIHYEVNDVLHLVHQITKDVFVLKKTNKEASIILGGHGQSGSLVQQFVSEYPNAVKGIVLMGTHIMLNKKLLHLNVPVMTVVGNIDGVTKVTTLAKVYENFVKQVKSVPTLKYRYPMVLLDGVNHGIFSNGELPLHLLLQDITSDTVTSLLLQDIVHSISLFFIYCEDNYNTDVLSQFDTYYKETTDMLEPLVQAQKITSSDYQSHWVKQSQMWLSELVGPDSTKINIESYFTYQSAFDPALFSETPSKITIYLFSQLDTPLEEIDISPQKSPSQIHARMFRRDKILQRLGKSPDHNSTERTCKDLNYASYLIAYHTSAEKVRRRFDLKHPGFISHDDILMPSVESWQNRNILVTRENRHVLHVTSYAYITDNNKDKGHIFCTLLPPIRAMEWIYYGILKLKN